MNRRNVPLHKLVVSKKPGGSWYCDLVSYQNGQLVLGDQTPGPVKRKKSHALAKAASIHNRYMDRLYRWKSAFPCALCGLHTCGIPVQIVED